MKKLILLAIVFSGLTTSCFKKDRTCECTDTSSTGKITTRTFTVLKATKSEAKSACQSTTNTNTFSSQTATSKSDCKLK
jgi:hypothetical protein